jgi:hypothetical protein
MSLQVVAHIGVRALCNIGNRVQACGETLDRIGNSQYADVQRLLTLAATSVS